MNGYPPIILDWDLVHEMVYKVIITRLLETVQVLLLVRRAAEAPIATKTLTIMTRA